MFSTILSFNPHWDYKNYNEYNSQKSVNLTITDRINLKYDAIDGSVVKGIQEPILFSFFLDKPAGFKIFFEAETIHYIKVNRSV